MFKKLLWKFAEFMYGRNGVDQLYLASGVFLFILLILQLFMDSLVLSLLSTALIIWTFYRFFSKNRGARQAENRRFLKFMNRIQKKTNQPIRQLKEIKTHRYRKCQSCETTLRLPRKRGKHTVRCPRCNYLNEVRIVV